MYIFQIQNLWNFRRVSENSCFCGNRRKKRKIAINGFVRNLINFCLLGFCRANLLSLSVSYLFARTWLLSYRVKVNLNCDILSLVIGDFMVSLSRIIIKILISINMTNSLLDNLGLIINSRRLRKSLIIFFI